MREITGTSDSLEISEETFPDNASISDLESELHTDQSVLGSPFENSAGSNKGLPLSFVLTPRCFFKFYLVDLLLPLPLHYYNYLSSFTTFHDHYQDLNDGMA